MVVRDSSPSKAGIPQLKVPRRMLQAYSSAGHTALPFETSQLVCWEESQS